MAKVFIILWSRTEGGKQNIKGVFKTARQAKAYVRQADKHEGGWFAVRPYTDVDLITPLKDLVRVIRNFECGDYSPIMDELFDAEEAIERGSKS